jgi:hypothetical protein
MLTAGSTLAKLLVVLRPFLDALFSAFGKSISDFFDRKRAEQNARALGAAEPKIETQERHDRGQQCELNAQTNAPPRRGRLTLHLVETLFESPWISDFTKSVSLQG